MINPVTAERISQLIGLVYDCAIDPGRWELAVDAIANELDFAGGIFAVQSLPAGQALLQLRTGVMADWPLNEPRYAHAMLELWGGLAKIMAFPMDEPIIQSQTSQQSDWPNNPWWRDFVNPHGIRDAVAVGFARDDSILGSVAWGRHESKGEVGEREIAALRLIGPHLRRAAAISRLLDMQTMVAKTFSTTIDRLSAGVLLVDDQLGLIHANAVAAAMLDSGDAMRVTAGRVAFQHPVATQTLAAAVAQCAGAEQDLGRQGIGVPLRRRSGEGCVAHVLPLKVGEIRPGLNARATAAIFIAPATAPPQLPADALALLYDLTPAETRVFEAIAAGELPADIASRLGISIGTVKTHLHKVFDKTGCSRQSELVKLASSLAMPY